MSNIYAVLIAAIPAIINVGILLYVLFKLPKTRVVKIFAVFIVALTLWQLEDMVSRLTSHIEVIAYWDRVFSVGWLFFAPILLHFIIYYTSNEKLKRNFPLVYIYAPFVVFYVLYMSNPDVIYFKPHPFWGWIAQPREGTLDLFQRYCIAGVVIFSLLVLFRYILTSDLESKRKKQAWLMAIGILIPAVQGIFTQVILTSTGGYEVPVTSSFLTFFSISTIIAFRKFNLFEISEAISTEEVLENIKTAVIVISRSGRIMYANAQARTSFGLLPMLQDYHISKIINPFNKEDFDSELLIKIQEDLVPVNLEIELINASGGTFDAAISGEVINVNGVMQGILLMISDITESNMQKRTIDFQRGQMEQIAFIQSHIVRAPLTRIMSISDILQKDDDLTDAEKSKFLEYLEISVHDLDRELRRIVDKATNAENQNLKSESPTRKKA